MWPRLAWHSLNRSTSFDGLTEVSLASPSQDLGLKVCPSVPGTSDFFFLFFFFGGGEEVRIFVLFETRSYYVA